MSKKQVVTQAWCVWIYDPDDDVYMTSTCDQLFQFTTGGIAENGFKFCPYCGGRIIPNRNPYNEQKTTDADDRGR